MGVVGALIAIGALFVVLGSRDSNLSLNTFRSLLKAVGTTQATTITLMNSAVHLLIAVITVDNMSIAFVCLKIWKRRTQWMMFCIYTNRVTRLI
jgi:hypothetical protein